MKRPTPDSAGQSKATPSTTAPEPDTDAENHHISVAAREDNRALTKSIAKNSRRLREERGISQQIVAQHLGVTFQQVQKYESGYNRLSGAAIAKLANLFHVPVASFFVGLIENNEDFVDESVEESHRVKRIMRAFSEVRDEAVIAILMDTARAFGKLETNRANLTETLK